MLLLDSRKNEGDAASQHGHREARASVQPTHTRFKTEAQDLLARKQHVGLGNADTDKCRLLGHASRRKGSYAFKVVRERAYADDVEKIGRALRCTLSWPIVTDC